MKIRLEKLNELPDALHPHNIPTGYIKEGDFISEPQIGECFWIGNFWATSTVKEIIDEHTFKTCNSIYKWSPLPEPPKD
jgi:hypothetical protein